MFGIGLSGASVMLLATGALALSAPCAAQDAAPAQTGLREIPAPAAMKDEIRLPVASPSTAKMRESWIAIGGFTMLRGVTVPTLTPVLPEPGKANGTSVIVAPGGGFIGLSMKSEGFDVAQFLAAHGITAFVLKYRLQPTADTPQGFLQDFGTWQAKTSQPGFLKTYTAEAVRLPTEDAKAAIRWVRSNAAKLGIDPKRVGFMGFSAGAITTFSIVRAADADTMPDFVAPIYGPYGKPDAPLPAKLPPMWAAIATDDEYFKSLDIGLIDAWKAHGDVEFRLYDKGGHGFGFSGKPGTTTAHWPQEFLWWLESRKLIPAAN